MPDSWDSFFVAQVGGSAALTGLVFVALSINLAHIIEDRRLVDRAGEAVVLLVLPVVVGLAALVPDVATRTTGILCLVPAALGFLIVTRFIAIARTGTDQRPLYEYLVRATVGEVAVLPALVGSILLVTGSTSGVYWIALGAATSITAGIFDAWVLLVEILR